MPIGGSPLGRYVVSLVASVMGLAVTASSVKLLEGPFFIFQFAAVFAAALYGGMGPGLVAMALSGIGFDVLFFGPTVEQYEAYRLASFGLVSVFFVWLAARTRDARADAEAARSRAEAAETEAKRIGAQQERLVAVVSHDLRGPLSAIAVTAEHLRGESSGRQAHALSRISTAAQRMDALVRDILDYARARHGSGLPVRAEAARLGEICRHIVDETRATHPRRQVLLEVVGDDAAAVDPARVEQVVVNLVTNAVQHGAEDEPVHVRVTGTGAGVRLEVTNSGPPISESAAATLFEPFHGTNGSGNFGLGLFIVREIAHAHGGSVSFDSGELGTTFAVTFPRGDPEPSGSLQRCVDAAVARRSDGSLRLDCG